MTCSMSSVSRARATVSLLDRLPVRRRLIRVDEGTPKQSDMVLALMALSGDELSCGACGSSKPVTAGIVRSEKTNRVFAYGVCASCKTDREKCTADVDAALAKLRGER